VGAGECRERAEGAIMAMAGHAIAIIVTGAKLG
jgi:hypothetical protein